MISGIILVVVTIIIVTITIIVDINIIITLTIIIYPNIITSYPNNNNINNIIPVGIYGGFLSGIPTGLLVQAPRAPRPS